MRNILTAALLLASSIASFNASAEVYSYETDELHNYGAQFSFPDLNLDRATANLVFTSNEFSHDRKLSKLTLDFENARDINAINFTRSHYDTSLYHAVVNDAWVFKQVIVEVRLDNHQPSNDVEIRISVPEVTTELSDTPMTPGVELFQSNAQIFDVSRKRVADTGVFRQNQKRVLVKLLDRLSASSPYAETQGQGFELEIDWHGHGVKTIYIDAQVPESQFHQIEAVGLIIEEHDFSGSVRHSLSIRYTDVTGNSQVTYSHPISQILEDVFSNVIY